MSISRLFRPNNDRNILRNLVSDNEGWQKIVNRQIADDKKTKLVELNAQIDAFAVRWGFKGFGVIWNPMFVREFLALKEKESRQKVGQKVFACIWIHPLLLSIRVAKFCPAIGYSNADMDIMAKATSAIQEKVDVTNSALTVLQDSFHQPDQNADDSDFELVNPVNESNASANSSNASDRSLTRQNAVNEEFEEIESEEKSEEKLEVKKEQMKEENADESFSPKFSLQSILCAPLCGKEENVDVKTEKDVKPQVITVVGFHPPKSEPMSPETPSNDRPFSSTPQSQMIRLPKPVALNKIGKIFADILLRCSSCTALNSVISAIEISEFTTSSNTFADTFSVNNHLEVSECPQSDDDFTDPLPDEYLDHLGTSIFQSPTSANDSGTSCSFADNSRAPKINRRRPPQEKLDITIPEDLFNTSANDSGTSVSRDNLEQPNVVRQSRTSWSESTPQGKLLRGGRGKYPH